MDWRSRGCRPVRESLGTHLMDWIEPFHPSDSRHASISIILTSVFPLVLKRPWTDRQKTSMKVGRVGLVQPLLKVRSGVSHRHTPPPHLRHQNSNISIWWDDLSIKTGGLGKHYTASKKNNMTHETFGAVTEWRCFQFLLIHNSLKMCFLELLDCYWRFWIICGTWRWCQQVTDCTGRTDPDRSSPPQPRCATLKHWILCDRRRAADVPVHLVTDCLTLQQKSKWKNSRCWRDGKHFDNEGLQTAGTFSFLCVCNSQDVLFLCGIWTHLRQCWCLVPHFSNPPAVFCPTFLSAKGDTRLKCGFIYWM